MLPRRVVVLHQGNDAWSREIETAVRERLRAASFDPRSVRFSSRPPASLDGLLAVVLLATAQAAADRRIIRDLDRVLAADVAVLPVIRRPDSFSDPVLPPSLRRVQGLVWDEDSRRVMEFVLAALGLAETDRRVFISYGRRDADRIARQLWTALNERGFDVFLDRFRLEPGDDWERRLDVELSDKSFVLVVESDAAADSRWVQHEVSYALKNHLGFAVLSLPGTRPERLVTAVPEPFRTRVSMRDVLGRGPDRRLRAPTLRAFADIVDQRHDEAILRRRDYLFRSAKDILEAAGWGVTAQPDWSLLIERPGARAELLRITPRPPRPMDLRILDRSRRAPSLGVADPLGRLVHETSDFDPVQFELLEWVAFDRDLKLSQLQSLAGATP